MSAQRSNAGSNKRVVIMGALIVVLGGVYVWVSMGPDAIKGMLGGDTTEDLVAWDTTEPAAESPAPSALEGDAASAVAATDAAPGVGTTAAEPLGAGGNRADLIEVQSDQEAMANEPAAASATLPTTQGVEGAQPAQSLGDDPGLAALDPSTRSILELRRKLDLAQTSLQVQQTQAAIADSLRQLEGARLGTNAIPMLVGVTGSPSRGLRAEFHLGGAQRVALSAGRWITPNWKLVAVSPTGAEVENESGERTQLVLGTRPPRAPVGFTAPTYQ